MSFEFCVAGKLAAQALGQKKIPTPDEGIAQKS